MTIPAGCGDIHNGLTSCRISGGKTAQAHTRLEHAAGLPLVWRSLPLPSQPASCACARGDGCAIKSEARLHVTVNALSSLQYLSSVCFSMEPLQAQDNSDIKALFVSPSETYARDFHRIFEPLQTVRCLFQEPTTETDLSPQEIVVAVNPLPVNGVGGEDIDGNLDAQLTAPIEEQGID